MPNGKKAITSTKLPHRIIPLPNQDKGFHESPKQLDDDLANFPWPSRILMCGAPNSGKTTLAMNILLHANPPYDRVVVWHADAGTKEWAMVTDEVVTKAPAIEEWDSRIKNCLVIDDVCLKALNKEEKARLDRLCGYTSTHKGLTVMITNQQPNAIPASIRRMCNVFFLWNSTDAQSLRDIALKCGIKSHELSSLLKLLPGVKDNLCVDLTGSPYRYRKNLFELIEEE